MPIEVILQATPTAVRKWLAFTRAGGARYDTLEEGLEKEPPGQDRQGLSCDEALAKALRHVGRTGKRALSETRFDCKNNLGGILKTPFKTVGRRTQQLEEPPERTARPE